MILYEGPSVLDGAPVVCIATGYASPSDNPKTGPMVQTWIMRSDLHPQQALIGGFDASVCGDCLHRGTEGNPRDCYVTLHTVGNVWKHYRAGGYRRASDRRDLYRAAAYGVRLGAYGDPAAVPWASWRAFVKAAPFVVGYTQFPERAPELRAVCMASAASLVQARAQQAAGWRTYRVMGPGEKPLRAEVICPASVEGGGGTVCLACRLCDGASRVQGPNVVERVHGSRAAFFVRNRQAYEHGQPGGRT